MSVNILEKIQQNLGYPKIQNINPNTQLPAIELGRTSTTTMRMDLGGGAFRCAKLTINKTASFRQIIAQGYAKCDDPNGSVERAVVNTTITN